MIAEQPSRFEASRHTALVSRLLPAFAWLREAAGRHRRILLAVATTLFVGGLAWALSSAGIDFASFNWSWLGAAVLLGFAGVILNGLELSACGGAIGKHMPASEAIHLSSVGILSNLLPIPASALVRGGALVAKGASVTQSGQILLYVGLLRLSVAGLFTGLALLSGPVGWPVVIASGAASAILFALIARVGGIGHAAVLLCLRVGMLGIVAGQLMLCFWALGANATIVDAALHAIAPVVGSAVGIVPGGLGVSEAIGAALAAVTSGSPAFAFAALALTRIAGYACAFVTVMVFQLRELVRAG